MKKTETVILISLIISIILSSFGAFASDCEKICDNVLRLHILANSDSAQDQALKLRIRDKILESSGEIFNSDSDLKTAVNSAQENLEKIERIAHDEIQKSGYDYTVTAYLTDMYFETRKYEDFTLPAGNYKAVRIEIGKAEGKNWWCVLFPALCLPASSQNTSISEVLSQSQQEIIESPKFEAKFFIFEAIKELKNGK